MDARAIGIGGSGNVAAHAGGLAVGENGLVGYTLGVLLGDGDVAQFAGGAGDDGVDLGGGESEATEGCEEGLGVHCDSDVWELKERKWYGGVL